MASDFNFNFQFQLTSPDDLNRILNLMERDVQKIIKQEYNKYGLLVEQGTKALIHHDRGDLEDSVHTIPAYKRGQNIVTEVVVNGKQALYLHDRVEPNYGYRPKYENGSKFPRYYKNGLGLRTRTKPGFRGEKPGRKYLKRAVDVTRQDFDEMNQRAIRRITEGWGG